jgi:hypothetical protein
MMENFATFVIVPSVTQWVTTLRAGPVYQTTVGGAKRVQIAWRVTLVGRGTHIIVPQRTGFITPLLDVIINKPANNKSAIYLLQ